FLDEQRILFSHRNLKGIDQLKEHHLTKNQLTPRSSALTNIRLPQVLNERVYALSNQSGIDNLYEINLTDGQSFQAKSNTQTWIHSYSPPQHDYPLVISQLTPKGLRLFEVANSSFSL